MRIGLDLRTGADITGVARYAEALSGALAEEDRADDFVVFKNPLRRIPFLTSHISFRHEIKRAKLDLLHVLGGTPPLGYRGRYVLTVHDLLIYRHPEWFPDGQWFSTKISFPSAVKLARRIIVPSLTTKNDLLDIFHYPAERISVIPHGVSLMPDMEQAANGKKGDYILCLGTIEPRKNISMLVNAYRLFIDANPDFGDTELVLAGAVGWKNDELIDQIRKTQCEGYKIKMCGRVSEEEKWRLLKNARCLAFPSRGEGFGLPLLEAMAAGTPVIASDLPVLHETAGAAALYAGIDDVAAWAEKVREIFLNEKTAAELRHKGLARAAAMTWQKCARLTLDAYRLTM